MFGLFRKKRKFVQAPPRTCVYAIGDIHGRADLLQQVLVRIEDHAARYAGFRKVLITLGDYVDRGPDSRAVIERLLSPPPDFETIHLMGNHEDLMLRFLSQPADGAVWFQNGGLATMESYGAPLEGGWVIDEAKQIRDRLAAVLPPEHLAFLRGLRAQHAEGDYLFVHAGVRPGVPLGRQDQDDLMWIRDEFLRSTRDHGKVVVHGHSVAFKPEEYPSAERPSRIGIDTGAYATNRLTCLALVGAMRSWIYTEPDPRFA
ncbi:metallophosphoesterase family protein [Iodidimonas sp. SYSU 1G8]|uniref:metallophosphoesterase family protein n=1 Tax=Iodidimonas sp. SYSU 1G8 TaxID=3133967 RepID=UPI0031FE9647